MGRLIDANEIGDLDFCYDVCIVGGGPAGITLAHELADSFKVLVVESGGIDGKNDSANLNSAEYRSNFKYRQGFANRCRHIGGAGNLWAGRLVPYVFDPDLDSEWGDLGDVLQKYYPHAAKSLGIDFNLIRSYKTDSDLLFAAWPRKTERFNMSSEYIQSAKFDIVYNLTCIGRATTKGAAVDQLWFYDSNDRSMIVKAGRYVLSCGGIETTRLMLLLKQHLNENMTEDAKNTLGAYVMDHPKITHGEISVGGAANYFEKYELKFFRGGRTKAGIKKTINDTRIYSNFVSKQHGIIERVYAKLANFYMKQLNAFFKFDAASEGHGSEIIYVVEPQEVLPYWLFELLKKFRSAFSPGVKSKAVKLTSYLEMKPRKNNFICLDGTSIDKFGNPLPVLNISLSLAEVEVAKKYFACLKKDFADIGAEFYYQKTYVSDTANFTDASHHLGGVRYSSRKSESVLLSDLQVAGVKNLYVLSTAVFPTGGVENPTFLLIAMAHYLSEVFGGRPYRLT